MNKFIESVIRAGGMLSRGEHVAKYGLYRQFSANKVTIKEVGLRDGLQSAKLVNGEPVIVPVNQKFMLAEKLVKCSKSPNIEVTSFVNPKLIPGLADSAELISMINASGKFEHANLSYLVLNNKGVETAVAQNVEEVALFIATSKTFNMKNANANEEQMWERVYQMTETANKGGISKVRAYLSTAFYCPFEKKMNPHNASEATRKLLEMGIYEVAISDTTGEATPLDVKDVLSAFSSSEIEKVALHFHDTHGRALENVKMGYDLGVRVFDSSIGGLGGCPFAPGAAGNVATEDLVDFFEKRGISTGMDMGMLLDAAKFVKEEIGINLSSATSKSFLESSKPKEYRVNKGYVEKIINEKDSMLRRVG